MKTINPDIQIFNSEVAARRYFTKITSGHLLKTRNDSRYGMHWFVDRSKEAVREWPNHYTLMDTK